MLSRLARSHCSIFAALLAIGELDAMRAGRYAAFLLLANSLMGASLDDEALCAGVATMWKGVFGWMTDDGHCYSTVNTWLLTFRSLAVLVAEDTNASGAMLRAWLPPPTELLRITENECNLRAMGSGAAHPALLCARLHGERLGGWEAAVEVAEGVLRIEQFISLLRTEACRLLGRALAALERRAAACEAAERAAAEAAKAR
jgi:hypothetical protein